MGTGHTGESHPSCAEGCPSDSGGDTHPFISENPFKRRDSILRSPPTSRGDYESKSKAEIEESQLKHLEELERSEEIFLAKIGENIMSMDTIVSGARNIHKTLRDSLRLTVLYYKRMKNNREEIKKLKELRKTKEREENEECEHQTQPESKKRVASESPEDIRNSK